MWEWERLMDGQSRTKKDQKKCTLGMTRGQMKSDQSQSVFRLARLTWVGQTEAVQHRRVWEEPSFFFCIDVVSFHCFILQIRPNMLLIVPLMSIHLSQFYLRRLGGLLVITLTHPVIPFDNVVLLYLKGGARHAAVCRLVRQKQALSCKTLSPVCMFCVSTLPFVWLTQVFRCLHVVLNLIGKLCCDVTLLKVMQLGPRSLCTLGSQAGSGFPKHAVLNRFNHLS